MPTNLLYSHLTVYNVLSISIKASMAYLGGLFSTNFLLFLKCTSQGVDFRRTDELG